MRKINRTSRATKNTDNSIINVDIPQWSEASNNEEKDIGIRKSGRKRTVDITNKEVKGKNVEEEDIKIRMCSRKSHVETVNEEMRGRNSKKE